MNKRMLWALIAGPGLALTSLLLVFFVLGRSTVEATPRRAVAMPDLQPQTATFTVSGTVTCQATGPLSDVEVYAWNRDKGTGFVGDVTDSSGAYRVTLEEGNYDLIFNPRCGSECASKAYKGASGPPDVTLNVVLSPGYTISGTVFASNGVTPVEGVSIYAFHHETADGFGLPLTKADGHYCIGLIPGTYDIGFTPPACLGLGPRTVVTTVNQNVSLDVTLPAGFTVAGCVTDESGNPVPGVQIYAYDPAIRGFGFAPSNKRGCYTGTLPLGTFDIQFIPPAWRGLGSITVVDVVSETGGCPNASRAITLPAGFTISGKVTCQGEPVKNVFVYADPVGGGAPGDDLVGWGVYSVDDGSYGLPLVSGTYRLEFTPPSATGLNARAFTTTQILTDTILDVNLCVCSGAWVTETVDSDGNVGLYTSLALAPTYPYTPYISYHDATSMNLELAWLSGTIWFSETVEPGGEGTSLALVPTYPYTSCIVHADWSTRRLLRYACRDRATWISMTIAGLRASDGSLALEPIYPYTPHVSYFSSDSTLRNLSYAYLNGMTWCSGTWEEKPVEAVLSETGWGNSLALERTYPYTPHISYYDRANGNLKHAWLSGTTWVSEVVDSKGDVGWYTSLALDSRNLPHISYFDATNNALKYARLSGATWFSETVDGVPWDAGTTSLELGQADLPYISYYDAINDDLRLARFDGKVWIVQTVDSEGDVGQNSSLALNRGGCPHISYYDATHGDLKYAYIPSLPDVMIVKSRQPSPWLRAGDWLTYTLTYSNTGAEIASGVLITDIVPAILTNVSATSSGAQVTPTGGISYTWQVEDLSSGEGGAITMTAMVSPAVRCGTRFANSALITTDAPDPNPTNDISSVCTCTCYCLYLPAVVREYP